MLGMIDHKKWFKSGVRKLLYRATPKHMHLSLISNILCQWGFVQIVTKKPKLCKEDLTKKTKLCKEENWQKQKQSLLSQLKQISNYNYIT
jgi:hypothetical protein